MTNDVRTYVLRMLRRDLYREPTEREINVWCTALVLNGAFAPDQVEGREKVSHEVDCDHRMPE